MPNGDPVFKRPFQWVDERMAMWKAEGGEGSDVRLIEVVQRGNGCWISMLKLQWTTRDGPRFWSGGYHSVLGREALEMLY